MILSGGDDGMVKVWDRRCDGYSPVGCLAGHKDGITFIDPRVWEGGSGEREGGSGEEWGDGRVEVGRWGGSGEREGGSGEMGWEWRGGSGEMGGWEIGGWERGVGR